MTELSELLREAAPPAVPFDVDGLASRMRQRRRRRLALRSGAVLVAALALVAGALAVVGRSSGSRVVDVGAGRGTAPRVVTPTTRSGGHTTIPVSTTTLEVTQSLAPPLPRAGQLVRSSWLIGADMLTPTSGIGVVSPSAACLPMCVTRGPALQAALASSTDGGATWRVEGVAIMGHLKSTPMTAQMAFTSLRLPPNDAWTRWHAGRSVRSPSWPPRQSQLMLKPRSGRRVRSWLELPTRMPGELLTMIASSNG